jgi:hypothetical protein
VPTVRSSRPDRRTSRSAGDARPLIVKLVAMVPALLHRRLRPRCRPPLRVQALAGPLWPVAASCGDLVRRRRAAQDRPRSGPTGDRSRYRCSETPSRSAPDPTPAATLRCPPRSSQFHGAPNRGPYQNDGSQATMRRELLTSMDGFGSQAAVNAVSRRPQSFPSHNVRCGAHKGQKDAEKLGFAPCRWLKKAKTKGLAFASRPAREHGGGGSGCWSARAPSEAIVRRPDAPAAALEPQAAVGTSGWASCAPPTM